MNKLKTVLQKNESDCNDYMLVHLVEEDLYTVIKTTFCRNITDETAEIRSNGVWWEGKIIIRDTYKNCIKKAEKYEKSGRLAQ
jgi:hypothetical protein